MSPKNALQTYVSVGVLAELLACTPAYVRKLVAEGVIERRPDGRFALIDTMHRYVAHLRSPERRSARAEAAAEYAKTKAHFLQLKTKQLQNELMAVDEATAFLDELIAVVIEQLNLIPSQVAGRDVPLRRRIEQVVYVARGRIAERVGTMTRQIVGDRTDGA